MQPPSSYPVTELLGRWSAGDSSARESLIPLVYDELRRIAGRCMAGGQSLTLQPTVLVHEAYVRLVKSDSIQLHNRVHFFALAATLMRQILVDHARKHAAAKRGGGSITLALDENIALPNQPTLDLIALDGAMKSLARLDARQSQIVELRFFGGLSIEETSKIVDLSPATVKREWATARAWLHRALVQGAA
jgi:RNA polymerase sigma factor (TIGR02999 family)